MWSDLAQPIINGILLGGLYAVVGIGLSTVFGIMRLTNLAHGDLVILASYLSFVVIQALGLHPLLSLIIVIPLMFLVGFGIQRGLLNRVLDKGAEPPLLVTFGLSIILQNLLLLLFTPDARTLMSSLQATSIGLGGNLGLPAVYLLDLGCSLVVVVLLSQFFRRTYLGRAIRAASDDEMVAQLVGVDTRKIYAYTMGIAMITAAVAGVLVGMTFIFYPSTGPQYLIIAFGVVVIGGLGNMVGTFLAGIILGLAQVLGAHFVGAGFQLLFGYIVLLLVLAFRPQGLFTRS